MSHATESISLSTTTTVIECLRQEVPSVPIDIDHEAELASYGLNSMKLVEVLFALEDAFEITIDEDEITETTFYSVRTIVTFLVGDKNVTER